MGLVHIPKLAIEFKISKNALRTKPKTNVTVEVGLMFNNFSDQLAEIRIFLRKYG